MTVLALFESIFLFDISVQLRQDGIFKQGFAKILGL